MKKKRLWFLYPVLALVLLFSQALPVNAATIPMPHNFYGSLTIYTELALALTQVEARGAGIETEITGNPITTTEVGEYGGSGAFEPKLTVQGDTIDEGTPIEFYVDGLRAKCQEPGDEAWQDTYPFHSDGLTELNLKVFDTGPPTVTLAELTPDPTNVNTPTFTGTATDTLSAIASVEYRVDDGEWLAAEAVDGTFNSLSEDYTFTTATLLDGAHTVYVRATDAATLSNTTAEANYASDEFAIDATAPVVEITSPSEGALLNTLEVTIVGTATEVDEIVVDGETASVVGGAFSIALTLIEGANSVTATATDTASNEGSDTVNFTINVTAPTVTIDIPDINAANETAVPVTITSNEDGTYTYTISDGTVAHDVTGSGDITAGVDVALTPDLSGLDEGPVTADASVEDAAGNTGVATQDTATKDTVLPTVTIGIPDINAANETAVPVTITSNEDGTYTYTISDGTDELTDTGAITGGAVELSLDLSSLADGPITADASVDDAVGNTGVATQASATKDTVLPTVTIDAVTSPTTVATQTVTGTMEEGATVVLTSAEATFGDVTYDTTTWSCDVSLIEEPNVITATATDAAENTATAEATIVYDITAPTVSIDIPDINAANETAVPVTITSNEDGTYSYTISDGTVAHDVTGSGDITAGVDVALTPDLSGLDEGPVTADASVDDAVGNTGVATQDTATKDTVLPTVTIGIADINAANETAVPVTITSDEDGTYTYTISDGTDELTGTGAITGGTVELSLDLSSLADGPITADASVDDAVGNTGVATQASATKDTVLPTVTIDAVTSPTTVATQTVTGAMEEGATVVLTSAEASCGDITYDTTTWSCDVSLIEGSNVITATATDAAENTATAEATIVYDVTAPTVTIDIPDINAANETAVPVTITSDEDGTYTYTISDGTVAHDVTGSGDITAGVDVALTPDLSGLDEGPVTADASVDDAAGNTGVATQDTATKDTVLPTVTIDAVTSPTTVATQTVTGAMEEGATVVLTSAEATCGDITYDTTTWSCNVTLIEGSNVITATATDAVGNTATDEATIVCDITCPTVTIGIPDINAANETAVPVTITSNEDGTYSYTISDGTVAHDVTGSGDITAGVDVALTPDLSGLADGPITADASVDDAVGNTGVATQASATKDTVLPTVTIDAVTSPTTVATQTVTGAMEEGATVVLTSAEATCGDVTNPTATTWSCDVTLVEDSNVITATATDAVGNTATDEATIVCDITVPTVTIDAVTSPTTVATQTVTGAMEEGATVVLTSAEATCGDVTNPTATTWSCDVTLIEGSNVITATATDAIGNTATDEATIVLDTAAPTVVSKSPAAGAPSVAVGTTVSVTFSEAMDALTITTSSFTLDSVSGSISYSSGTNTATFTPSVNLSPETTYTATLSTAITDAAGNPLAEYSWSFTTAMASLQDLIDETESGGTLELEAGFYSGDVTIDKPMTITGTEGTIISGGIHVLPLTGSEFTIENVTITDYTDYGIWIELVYTDDVFNIRNNTILGVEGSVIGIKVEEVEADGILNIEQNTISGNEVGIELLRRVAAGAIEFNNIVDNDVGLKLLVVGEHMIGASMNWWGDISGPEHEPAFGIYPANPGGIGDKIELADGLSYEPWLTRDFQTVLDDNIAYYGMAMLWLNTGWNIISTPVALDPAADTWGEYVTLGDGLDIHATSPAYGFDAENQQWVALTSDDALEPCDAIYVRMASDDIAAILVSPDLSVPSKELYSGWNLISLAWIEGAGMPANEALVTVEEVAGGLTGYKLVVSPGVNVYENSWIYIARSDIEPWTDPNDWPPPDGWMIQTSGYWVFMLNDGTLAGFTFTPISLW